MRAACRVDRRAGEEIIQELSVTVPLPPPPFFRVVNPSPSLTRCERSNRLVYNLSSIHVDTRAVILIRP